jgi:4-amino-4-deoxy-L-arabinose transferase-like glycosyltransferase
VFELALAAFGPYGYFVDEFYYLACAKRLAWGYVDHPPLSIFVLAAARTVLGSSAPAIRAPAVAAVTGTIFVAARLARELGGNRYSQALAALCTATSSFSLVMASFYSMNAIELLLWSALILALAVASRDGAPRAWLAAGLLLGLGLENKHTTILLAMALAVGVLATPLRAQAATRWPWLCLGLAALLLAPNLAWQAAHGFPSLEFYRNAQASKNVPTPPVAALVNQILLAGPGNFVVWIAGAVWLLRARAAKPFRFIGVAFTALFAAQILSSSSRPDRIAGIYPAVLAAGAVAIERLAQRRRALRVAVPLLAALGTVVVVPITLPFLPPERAAAVATATGLFPQLERGKSAALPQLLADRTGWDEFVADVEGAYAALTPEERREATVYAHTYGGAGSIERLWRGAEHPPVVSPHNSYWLWGPGPRPPGVLIAVGLDPDVRDALFETHEVWSVHRCTYCPAAARSMPIVVARRPRAPLSSAWLALKHFD